MARASTTSDPFNAIAEPRRRHILEFIAGDERSVTDIADALDLGQPSVSKHLQVLRDVGLVRMRRDGRRTMYRINPETLRTIHDWSGMFARHWRGQLRRIKAHAEGRIRPSHHVEPLVSPSRTAIGVPATAGRAGAVRVRPNSG